MTTFSHTQWDALLARSVDSIRALAETKGSEYAHGDDRLDNFRRAGAELGLPMEIVWRIYAGKHWDAITTYIRDIQNGTLRMRSEPIEGRIDDLIVYLLLLKAMVEEKKQGQEERQREQAPDLQANSLYMGDAKTAQASAVQPQADNTKGFIRWAKEQGIPSQYIWDAFNNGINFNIGDRVRIKGDGSVGVVEALLEDNYIEVRIDSQRVDRDNWRSGNVFVKRQCLELAPWCE